jgi:PEP-CTERM motif
MHVAATNDFGAAAFIGDFTLSDANFQFANGSQFLVTDTTHWPVSLSGFGSGYGTPFSFGPNGTGPWNTRPCIDASAQFIWNSASPCTACNAYFSTAITPLVAVPEPETYALMMAGLALFGFVARRKRKLD